MIRVVCTWALIVLAASPFTAPFSTCDVSVFLGSQSSAVLVPAIATCAEMADCSGTSDAGSISPLIVRVVLTRDAVLALREWPASTTADTPAFARAILIEHAPALEDSPHQPIVLRL